MGLGSPSSSPARQFNARDVLISLNGSPQFLGRIVSGGTTVNNATTATPFHHTPRGQTAPINYDDTLAGKTLLVQPTAAGLVLPGTTAADVTMTQQTGIKPGVLLALGEKAIIVMGQTEGWLQWSTVAGNGNLLVWELV